MLLANAVAVVHGLAVLFMLAGGLIALRRPWVLAVHAPVALLILGVNLAGADCPLTTLELRLRDAAGAAGYDSGFLGHYLFEPLDVDEAAAGTQVAIFGLAFSTNALAYALLAARLRRTNHLGRAPA